MLYGRLQPQAKKYQQAIAAYEKAVALWGVDADYAAYQTALAYQQLGKYDRVVESLLSFHEQYANSTYTDDAWYRMGEAYMKLGASEKALAMFDKVQSSFPNSVYVADANENRFGFTIQKNTSRVLLSSKPLFQNIPLHLRLERRLAMPEVLM